MWLNILPNKESWSNSQTSHIFCISLYNLCMSKKYNYLILQLTCQHKIPHVRLWPYSCDLIFSDVTTTGEYLCVCFGGVGGLCLAVWDNQILTGGDSEPLDRWPHVGCELDIISLSLNKTSAICLWSSISPLQTHTHAHTQTCTHIIVGTLYSCLWRKTLTITINNQGKYKFLHLNFWLQS